RAEYAATFQQTADFDDIARQLLLMDQHMRDPDSGLLKHGWDESKQMPWRTRPPASAPRSGDVQWAGTAWPSSMSSTGSPPQATSPIRSAPPSSPRSTAPWQRS